jgi:aryl-alcohol dehydrogenase-like predicted oxidoreductase
MISKLIIGTAQFGMNYGITNKNYLLSNNELDKIFKFCYSNNILIFDTAQDYGKSEDILSKYCKIYADFKIITKSNFIKNKENDLDNIINNSIFKFNKIEYYLLHNFQDYKNIKIMNILQKLKNENKINKIGVSIYNVNEAILLLKENKIDVIQIPFNYLDNQWNNEEFQNLIIKNKVEIHVRSIFLQGLLINKPNKYPINISKDDFDILENIINDICKKLNLSKIELCFYYINSIEWINKFLIGIDNINQLKSNYNIINKNLKLNKEDIKYIENKIKNINKIILDPSKWIFN